MCASAFVDGSSLDEVERVVANALGLTFTDDVSQGESWRAAMGGEMVVRIGPHTHVDERDPEFARYPIEVAVHTTGGNEDDPAGRIFELLKPLMVRGLLVSNRETKLAEYERPSALRSLRAALAEWEQGHSLPAELARAGAAALAEPGSMREAIAILQGARYSDGRAAVSVSELVEHALTEQPWGWLAAGTSGLVKSQTGPFPLTSEARAALEAWLREERHRSV